MKRTVTILIWLVINTAFAQKQYNVFNWKSEFTLNTFLIQKVNEQYNHRRAILSNALLSQASLQVYQDSCRARYKTLIGDLPQKSALNARVIKTIKQDGYRIENVVYESLPGHHVTANLYIPIRKGTLPAILFLCGHEAEAKATESYQKTAMLLAQNGFVVLVIDPISQGERMQLLDKNGTALTRGGTTEHTLINAAANLVGSSAVAYELWDNIRGVDYLTTRSEVDKEKIGCIGNSGGATQLTYLIAFDERIKAAAPCSYIASRERNFYLIGANDGCQHIPGEGKEQLEISDFLIMFAPNPLLVLAGRYDFVDYIGTQDACNEMRAVYSVFGSANKFELFTVDDGHGISKPKREAAVSWFRKWFYNDTRPVKEGNLQVLSSAELHCTVNGQVNTTYANEVNDLLRTRNVANAFAHQRTQFVTDVIAATKQALNFSAPGGDFTAENLEPIQQGGLMINKILLRRKGEVPLPILSVFPSGGAKQVLLWLDDEGKHRVAANTASLENLLKEGYGIIIPDLRGIGEMKDPLSYNDSKYFNAEYRNAITALHIGSSLPAQRVTDIINLIDFVYLNGKDKKIHVRASGTTAIPAIHAAVLDKRITKLKVDQSISSFYDIINMIDSKTVDNLAKTNWYSYVIPGVLKYYDIPDLIRYLKQKSVWQE